jgi:hypothetical protein
MKVKILPIFVFSFLFGCSDTHEVKHPSNSTYVPSTINYKGQFRKCYVRKSSSLNPNAIRNQTSSKYYYLTERKYHRKHIS